MSNKVTFDYSKVAPFVSGHEVVSMKKLAQDAKKVLVEKTGDGNDFLGWIDLPVDYDKEEFARIKKAAEKIRNDSEVSHRYWRFLSGSKSCNRILRP